MFKKQQSSIQQKKHCLFCVDKREVDYKDVQTLKRFISPRAKIFPPKRTGACAKHQRQISQAIKRARTMALLSGVGK